MKVQRLRRGRVPITRRLLEGERLFFPDVAPNGLGLYSIIRSHGKFLHITETTHNGQHGIEVWADDDPYALTEHRTLPEPISL